MFTCANFFLSQPVRLGSTAVAAAVGSSRLSSASGTAAGGGSGAVQNIWTNDDDVSGLHSSTFPSLTSLNTHSLINHPQSSPHNTIIHTDSTSSLSNQSHSSVIPYALYCTNPIRMPQGGGQDDDDVEEFERPSEPQRPPTRRDSGGRATVLRLSQEARGMGDGGPPIGGQQSQRPSQQGVLSRQDSLDSVSDMEM